MLATGRRGNRSTHIDSVLHNLRVWSTRATRGRPARASTGCPDPGYDTWSSTPGCTSSAPPIHRRGRTRRCCSSATAAGVALEVVGVELADGRLRIIHAMPMRRGYQDLYEEARRWRR
jgi:hypothetical protein